jgi:hypothetical protein
MPYIIRLGSQVVIIDDRDAGRVVTQLVRMVRVQNWGRAGGPDSCFQSYFRIWQSHSRYHDINIFLWTVEALARAYARLFAEGFMQARLFRRLLKAQLQRAAGG